MCLIELVTSSYLLATTFYSQDRGCRKGGVVRTEVRLSPLEPLALSSVSLRPMLGDLAARLQRALGEGYEVTDDLGGGMARVFVAREVHLGRDIVVKVLPPELGAGLNIGRFRREIQLAARLQHPHIVPLLFAGSKDDLLYYAMPRVEGETLRSRLQRSGELTVGETIRILHDVADAIDYAH